MRILYIANIRIPTEKAHGIQIMKMCEAFSDSGHDVTLVVPRRLNHIKDGPFKYYGVKKNFKIKKLPTLDLVRFGRVGFWVQSISFAISFFLYSIPKKVDVIYSRDELPLLLFSFFKKNIVWETHMPRDNIFSRVLIKRLKKLITISRGLKDFYFKKGVHEDKIIVAPDAVDIKKFDTDILKEEARERLNLPLNKKIILYTGHLYDWKGVDTLAESSKYLSKDEEIVFVGGMNKDVKKFKEKYKDVQNILILGQKPHKDIPFYLKSADVLVLPNSGKSDVSKYYTSPMKLFEYMASGRPIVASGVPSIREVLNNRNAILIVPDSPEDLARGVRKALQDTELADRIARNALSDVLNYSWERRVSSIIEFLSK